MAKIVEVPLAGASITGDVAVVSLDDFVGSTDMAYSIALSVRKAGKRVSSADGGGHLISARLAGRPGSGGSGL